VEVSVVATSTSSLTSGVFSAGQPHKHHHDGIKPILQATRIYRHNVLSHHSVNVSRAHRLTQKNAIPSLASAVAFSKSRSCSLNHLSPFGISSKLPIVLTSLSHVCLFEARLSIGRGLPCPVRTTNAVLDGKASCSRLIRSFSADVTLSTVRFCVSPSDVSSVW
jgi:hypothetical protein